MPTTRKKTAAKKSAAKKPAAKKAAPKKAVKKTTAKKPTAKKATAKKTAKKATTKKAATKAAPKKVAGKKTAPKKAPASKSAAPSAAALAVGKKAPDFSLTSTSGETISLSDYIGRKSVVLYFYPKDMTPGCTIEACNFRDRSDEIEDLGAVVLGVSPDSVASHGKFTEKHGLNFPLLADPGAALAKKYDVWKEKNLYGKKSMGIERTTFLIDKEGKIASVWRRVNVEGHDDQVIDAIQELEPAQR